MGQVITNLKARFGIDTADFKKGLKDGDKAIDDFTGTAGSALDEFASMFGINMSAVNDALGTANKSLNFLGQSFKAAAVGGNVLTIAMKVLKVALIATGIGALIVALGSLVSYFKRSGEGADKFAKILSQVKSVVNNVIERLAIFGEGLFKIMTGRFKEGWEAMRSAFKGIGEEITEDWKAAGALAEAEDALEDREIALINSLEERRAKVAELRLLAKEEVEDQKAKLSLLSQADSLIKSIYGDQISLEKERLRLLNERLALQTKDPTDEQRREVAEQEAKINSLLREQSQELKAITREKGAALKIVNEDLALEEAKANQIQITRATLENITMPDFRSSLAATLAPIYEVQKTVNEVMIDIGSAISGGLENMASGLGEFFGSLATGNADMADFGKMVIGVFADLAINVGKIAIGAGLAVLGVKKALETLNPAVAIAAGIALIAIGTAVKGALSSAASGGGSASTASSAGSGSGGTFTYDTYKMVPVKVQVEVTGKLMGEGSDLAAVIEQEQTRKYKNT